MYIRDGHGAYIPMYIYLYVGVKNLWYMYLDAILCTEHDVCKAVCCILA